MSRHTPYPHPHPSPVNNAYLLAKRVLTDNMDLLKELSKQLCDTETVTAEEFQMLLVKYGTKSVPYESFPTDDGKGNMRDLLPFQQMPKEYREAMGTA